MLITQDGEESETRFLTLQENASVRVTGLNYYDLVGLNTYRLSKNAVRTSLNGMTFHVDDERLVTVNANGTISANGNGVYGRTIVSVYDANGHMGQLAVTVVEDTEGIVTAPMVSSGTN